MKQEQSDLWQSVKSSLAPLDSFAETFSFQLPNGRSTYHTRVSIASTICLIGILVTYSLLKLQDTMANNDTRVVSRQVDSYFDDSHIFNMDKHKDGL